MASVVVGHCAIGGVSSLRPTEPNPVFGDAAAADRVPFGIGMSTSSAADHTTIRFTDQKGIVLSRWQKTRFELTIGDLLMRMDAMAKNDLITGKPG